MKLKSNILALALGSSGLASAATVAVSCTSDLVFTTNAASSANDLNNTWTAKVGFYSGGVLSTTATFETINATWANVGQVQFATGGGAQGVNGWFQASGLNYTSGAAATGAPTGLGGKNIWLWVTNGSNGNLLMQATSGAAGAFLFKNDSDIPSSGSVGISQTAIPGWTVALGSRVTTGANSAYGGSYVVNVSAIPEPSAALLGAFGAIGLLRRRRA